MRFVRSISVCSPGYLPPTASAAAASATANKKQGACEQRAALTHSPALKHLCCSHCQPTDHRPPSSVHVDNKTNDRNCVHSVRRKNVCILFADCVLCVRVCGTKTKPDETLSSLWLSNICANIVSKMVMVISMTIHNYSTFHDMFFYYYVIPHRWCIFVCSARSNGFRAKRIFSRIPF